MRLTRSSILVFAIIVSHYSFSETFPVFANELTQKECTGDGVSFRSNGICYCDALDVLFNPRTAPKLKLTCKYATQVREKCKRSEGWATFRNGRCFCNVTRQYVSANWVPKSSGNYEMEHFDTITLNEESFRDAILRVNSEIEQCKEESEAILAFDERFAGSSLDMKTQLKAAVEMMSYEDPYYGTTLRRILNTHPETFDRSVGARTIKSTTRLPGAYGGHRYVVEPRVGIQDINSFDNRDAPGGQGSFGFSVSRLGTTLGEFFGFKWLDQKRCTRPDVAEVNGAIRKLNRAMKKKGLPESRHIQAEFYDASEETTNFDTYLDLFAKNYLIPVGIINEEGDETLLFHDVNFHIIGVILTPPSVLELARSRIKYTRDFYHYFKTHYPTYAKSGQFEAVFQTITRRLVIDMDLGTAVPASGLDLDAGSVLYGGKPVALDMGYSTLGLPRFHKRDLPDLRSPQGWFHWLQLKSDKLFKKAPEKAEVFRKSLVEFAELKKKESDFTTLRNFNVSDQKHQIYSLSPLYEEWRQVLEKVVSELKH